MITFAPFEPQHLGALRLQSVQRILGQWDLETTYQRLPQPPGLAHTGFVNGVPVGSAGVRIKWPGTGVAWAVVSTDVPMKAWHRITTKAAETIRIAHARGMVRIEAHVRHDFNGGHKLMAALGFHSEGLLRMYGPDGQDYVSYARIDGDGSPLTT